MSSEDGTTGRILEVGDGYTYATVQEAYKASEAGDTIKVHEGTYNFAGNEYLWRYNDSAPILFRHAVDIVGVGDVVFQAGDVVKGALVTDAAMEGTLTVSGITFQGAHNRDFNGAGIRHQGGDLVVDDCTFIDNQNGILGGSSGGSVTVSNSHFSDNGHGDGKSHSIYINKGESLVVENSTFEETNLGHHVKSLTKYTEVRDSVLDDGDSTASMAIDVTAGGDVFVSGNTIIQGPNTDNHHIVFYSTGRAELVHGITSDEARGEIILENNTIVNHATRGTLVGTSIYDEGTTIALHGNDIQDTTGGLFISNTAYLVGEGNVRDGETMAPGLVDPNWPIPDIDLPETLGEVPQPSPQQSWLADGGVYAYAGFGRHTVEGTDGRDVLKGVQSGKKTLVGGDGDDVYLPWSGYDIVEHAGGGFDWVLANSGNNAFYMPDNVEGYANYSDGSVGAIFGNELDNVLIGGRGAGEKIIGEGGDDVMYGGGTGGDEFRGGSGIDRVVFDGVQAAFAVDLSARTVTYGDGSVDSYDDGVEFLVFDDATLDVSSPVAPEAGDGDDGGGGDVGGDPVITPAPGDAGAYAGSSYTLPAGLLGGVLTVETGEDGAYLVHGWGSATLTGTAGTDVLESQEKGRKTLVGGDGDDFYLVNGQTTIVETADGGTDWVVTDGRQIFWYGDLPAGVENYLDLGGTASLTGNGLDNVLIALGGAGQTIDGGAGNDVLFGGGSGGDTFVGGDGTDAVVFDGRMDDFAVDVDGGTVTYADGAVDQFADDVEVLLFDDVMVDLLAPEGQRIIPRESDGGAGDGDGAAEETVCVADLFCFVAAAPGQDCALDVDGDGIVLSAGWGIHRLDGGTGDDVLEATSKGLKTMVGGAGDDVYLLNGQAEIVEAADGGFDWAVHDGSVWAHVLADNVEGYVNTSDGTTRTLHGNALDNVLVGGRGGGERMLGLDGDDVFYGRGGGDRYEGGAGTDVVLFDGSLGDHDVDIAAGTITAADGTVDTIDGVEMLAFYDGTDARLYEVTADGLAEVDPAGLGLDVAGWAALMGA